MKRLAGGGAAAIVLVAAGVIAAGGDGEAFGTGDAIMAYALPESPH